MAIDEYGLPRIISVSRDEASGDLILVLRLREPAAAPSAVEASQSGGALLTIQQAADRLGISKRSMHRLAGQTIPVIRVGEATVRVSSAELDRYVLAHTTKPEARLRLKRAS